MMKRTTPWLLLLALSAHSPARALAQTGKQTGSPPPQVPLVLDDAWRSSIELKVRTDGAEQALTEVRDTTQWLREQLAAQSSKDAGDALDEGLLGALATSVEMELRILVHQGRLAEAQALCATYFEPNPAAASKGDPRISTFVTLALRKSDAYRKLVVSTPGTRMTDLPLATPTSVLDRTRAIVAESIQAGDTDLLLRLGASAADAYEQLALDATQPAELLLSSPGPLAWLGSVDPTRAVRVASALVRRTGSGWKAAIATELTSQGGRANPLTLNAEVMRQPATLALVAELAEGDELNADHVENITLGLASAAVEGPVMARYLARALPGLEQREKLGEWPFIPLTQQMLRSSDPSERARAVKALANHNTLRLEDVARLAQDPVADVREAVAAALARVTPNNKDLSEEEQAPWRALVRDASPAVRRALYLSILDYLSRSGQSPFTVPELESLFEQLSTAPDSALSAEFALNLSRAVSWLDRAEGSTSERAQAALSLLRSPWPPVRDAAFTSLRRSRSLRDALSEVLQSYQARPDDPEDLTQYLDDFARVLASADDGTRNALYAGLVAGGPPQIEWAKTIIAGPPGRSGNRASEVSFTEMDADTAIRALCAMIEADPERVWQALFNTDWAPVADALRSALQSDHLDARTRVVLSAALIAAEPASVAPRAAVRAALDELAGGDLETLQGSIGLASSAASKAPSAALSLLSELLASPTLPDEAFDLLSAPKPLQDGYPRELALPVVDALERRVHVAGADAASRFASMQYYLLKAMIKDPALYRPKLARNWLKGDPRLDDLALVAKLAGDTEMVDILRDQVLDSLARYAGSSDTEIKALIERALAVAGEESAARLAAIAATTRSHGLREELVKRLETIALSRELAARLARTSTPEDDRARAIEETLKLLNDPMEGVRVQAIRGLAILGATAEVPRLVGLVGSGSAAEKKAALEALDLLYRRAAQADQ